MSDNDAGSLGLLKLLAAPGCLDELVATKWGEHSLVTTSGEHGNERCWPIVSSGVIDLRVEAEVTVRAAQTGLELSTGYRRPTVTIDEFEKTYYAAAAAALLDEMSTLALLGELQECQRLAASCTDLDMQDLIWFDSVYEVASQRLAFTYLSSRLAPESTLVQIGGTGTQVVRLMIATGCKGLLITPMAAEAAFGVSLANELGLGDRLLGVVAYGEELPIRDGAIDAIILGGSLHHLDLEVAAGEMARVLAPHGRMAAFELWRAPGYALGTKILGKRERGIACQPLVEERMRPLRESFRTVTIRKSGPIVRYMLLAAQKFGFEVNREKTWSIYSLVDNRLPWMRDAWGSCAAVLAEK